MRTLTGLLLCLLAESTLFAAPIEKRSEPRKPNIVVFFMDDLGYSDLTIDGAPDVETPNLDQLARDGVRLTHCYAAAPVCTPTRVAFMTGRYQHRLGLENVIAPCLECCENSSEVDSIERPLIVVSDQRHDLAAKHTDVLREIAAKHAEWQKALTAPGGPAPAEP